MTTAQATPTYSMQNIKAVKVSTKMELYRRLNIARSYIHENYDRKLDIQKIARIAGISTYHFFRTYKQAFGLSPHQYLIKVRLENAYLLLQDNSLTVTDIAYMTGFADIFTFSKAFKKAYGISPSKMR